MIWTSPEAGCCAYLNLAFHLLFLHNMYAIHKWYNDFTFLCFTMVSLPLYCKLVLTQVTWIYPRVCFPVGLGIRCCDTNLPIALTVLISRAECQSWTKLVQHTAILIIWAFHVPAAYELTNFHRRSGCRHFSTLSALISYRRRVY